MVDILLSFLVGALLGTAVGVFVSMRRSRVSLFENGRNELIAAVDPIRQDFAALRDALADKRRDEAADSARLRQQFADEMMRLHSAADKFSSDANGLKAALLGNVNVRGQWGEAALEQILVRSGLIRGVHYSIQPVISRAGTVQRPDVIVHQPDGSNVVIDSKANFPDYYKYIEADSPEDRKAALAGYIRSIQTTARDLASRHYEKLVDDSVEFVLMFVPVEGAYQTILSSAPETVAEIFSSGVLIVGPSALIVMLTLIERMWHRNDQEKNTHAILTAAQELADRVVTFGVELEKIGIGLNAARDAYDTALRRLISTDGRSQSVALSLENLRELNVIPGKPVPKCFRDGIKKKND